MDESNNCQKSVKMSVLIPDAEDWLTLKVLRCLGQESIFKNHILSKMKIPISRFCRYCTSYHFNKSQNDDEWIEEINKLITKLQINVILPITVEGFELISRNRAKISKSVRIPALPEPEKIVLTNDKWAFYKFLCQHDLPSVPTVYAGNSGEDINLHEINSIEFPALLKPLSENGGAGFLKIEKAGDLEQAWHDVRILKNQDYILQSYIPADHLALSIYSREGKILAYTLYQSLLQPNPYRIGELMEFKNDDKIIEIGSKLISDLKWNGVANIDFLVDKRDKSVTILEFNPRFWQSVLGSFNAGVNFPSLWCFDTMGVKTSFDLRQSVNFASPKGYLRILFKRLKGKEVSTKIRLKESALKFTLSDPLPEIIDSIQKVKSKIINTKLFRFFSHEKNNNDNVCLKKANEKHFECN